ncbi:hypothetical protein G7Z17_g6214 [Cylindrodendrum hubeiense]|uniref:UDENN FLCN/SMCR8-type domain-containing protein n=1 Tax=Cylindrodendrum hubeiense TaxID=595255 RepID=A0A9P5HFN5_9HYPO|nr:hypothetical protein G7Z17_g6214 [Cylindrodendrum hubeiense]
MIRCSPTPPATATPTSPLSSSPAFVTTQSAGSAVSGGPIFFGDSLAGYTTAYIFRIPDVHARGHKRVYAFMALSTHRERLAMKTFAVVSTAFRDFAGWIQQLAEAEAERAADASPIGSTIYGGGPAPKKPAADAPAAADRGGSSFLTGGSGVHPKDGWRGRRLGSQGPWIGRDCRATRRLHRVAPPLRPPLVRGINGNRYLPASPQS